ncbi:hypothetical protein tinsulaeT_32640 [Thalassotalea insulae]|uniref:Thioredoxin domain-containing protein n=1 Tax=Thalassotalea insulae TaxID=2056778 RepID=A0ABQ6GX83_9GAMM|nr:redoxin domain-containing protein [Thalassotalea insulae]GLX79924.1 hypothetical protein tinsulaeT_32640 [Thalassotalea insulae]
MKTYFKLLGTFLMFFWFTYSANAYNQMSITSDISAETLSGAPISYKMNALDKPLLILFSDSLCPFHHLPNCEAKIEKFKQVAQLFDTKVNFLQVVKGYYVTQNDVINYNKKFNIKVSTIWDTENKLFKLYNVFSNPYAILINKSGKITYRKDDFIGELAKEIGHLAEEKASNIHR